MRRPAPAPAPTVDRCAEVIRLRGVNFDFDRAEIRPDAAVILDEAATLLADALSDCPSRTVSVAVENRTALDLLEDLLDQASDYVECTWQIRRGFVEVGTKARLSVPAARERRTYHIRDLMIEAPRFATRDERTPVLGKYGAAYLGKPAPTTGGPSVGPRNTSTTATSSSTAIRTSTGAITTPRSST